MDTLVSCLTLGGRVQLGWNWEEPQQGAWLVAALGRGVPRGDLDIARVYVKIQPGA